MKNEAYQTHYVSPLALMVKQEDPGPVVCPKIPNNSPTKKQMEMVFHPTADVISHLTLDNVRLTTNTFRLVVLETHCVRRVGTQAHIGENSETSTNSTRYRCIGPLLLQFKPFSIGVSLWYFHTSKWPACCSEFRRTSWTVCAIRSAYGLSCCRFSTAISKEEW